MASWFWEPSLPSDVGRHRLSVELSQSRQVEVGLFLTTRSGLRVSVPNAEKSDRTWNQRCPSILLQSVNRNQHLTRHVIFPADHRN